jgi:hypothetical protein
VFWQEPTVAGSSPERANRLVGHVKVYTRWQLELEEEWLWGSIRGR